MSEDKLHKKFMEKEMENYEKERRIRDSVWKCNEQQTLITLQNHYIIFEQKYNTTTIIFYKDIITLKKNIHAVDVDGVNCGGTYYFHEIILKTANETFNITSHKEPYLMDSPMELFFSGEELYSQILDKMVENK